MADLTPIDEKLGEVLGLAQAAQKATDHVAGMEGGDAFREQLERMGEEAKETERRTDAHVDTLEGRKTAIRELAREPASSATGRSSRGWPPPSGTTRSKGSPPGRSRSSAGISARSELRGWRSPRMKPAADAAPVVHRLVGRREELLESLASSRA